MATDSRPSPGMIDDGHLMAGGSAGRPLRSRLGRTRAGPVQARAREDRTRDRVMIAAHETQGTRREPEWQGHGRDYKNGRGGCERYDEPSSAMQNRTATRTKRFAECSIPEFLERRPAPRSVPRNPGFPGVPPGGAAQPRYPSVVRDRFGKRLDPPFRATVDKSSDSRASGVRNDADVRRGFKVHRKVTARGPRGLTLEAASWHPNWKSNWPI